MVRKVHDRKGCNLIFAKTVHSWRATFLFLSLVICDQWIMHKFKGSNINFAPDFTHHCLNINHDIKSLFSVHPRRKKVAPLFLWRLPQLLAFLFILGEPRIFFRVLWFVISELCTSLLCSLTLQLLFGLHCVVVERYGLYPKTKIRLSCVHDAKFRRNIHTVKLVQLFGLLFLQSLGELMENPTTLGIEKL